MFDYLVVGAGFAGATIAERLATHAGKKVLICDKRPHIGGNAYDHYDEAGILVPKYGPHIFIRTARRLRLSLRFTIGAPISTASWRASMAKHSRSRSTWIR